MTEEGRVQPRNIQHRELDGKYEGWWFEFDADYTLGQLRDLNAGEEARQFKALSEIVTSWNFVSKQGEAVPVSPEGFDLLGVELWQAMGSAIREQANPPEASSASSPSGA